MVDLKLPTTVVVIVIDCVGLLLLRHPQWLVSMGTVGCLVSAWH